MAVSALSVTSVSKRFGGLQALAEVSLQIDAGEILGILGPNGAGKTTLINILSGFAAADSGQIRMEANDITSLDLASRARIGLLRTFQNTRPSHELSVGELLRLAVLAPRSGPTLGDAYSPDQLLGRFDLLSYRDVYLAELPYGVQKMVNLAAMVLVRPRVLLLDEPFAGVAEGEIDKLAEVVRQLQAAGVAIGLVEHNVKSVIALSQRVLVLDAGRVIYDGLPQGALESEAVQIAYLGTSATRH